MDKQKPQVQEIFKKLDKGNPRFIKTLIEINPMFSILDELYPLWVLALIRTTYYDMVTNQRLDIKNQQGWMKDVEVQRQLYKNKNIKIISEILVYADLYENMDLEGLIFINPAFLGKDEIPMLNTQNNENILLKN